MKRLFKKEHKRDASDPRELRAWATANADYRQLKDEYNERLACCVSIIRKELCEEFEKLIDAKQTELSIFKKADIIADANLPPRTP